jgi:AbrB family looped-hinge helix DNA binding protein
MESTSVTSKGQVTIPKHVRQQLGIRAGSRVAFRIVDNRVEMEVVSAPMPMEGSGFGLLRSRRKSVPADVDVATFLTGK